MFSQKAAAFRVDALLADSPQRNVKRQHESTGSNKSPSEYSQSQKKFKYSVNSCIYTRCPTSQNYAPLTSNPEHMNKTDQNQLDQKMNKLPRPPSCEGTSKHEVNRFTAETKTNESVKMMPKDILTAMPKTDLREEKQATSSHYQGNLLFSNCVAEAKKCLLSNSHTSLKLHPRTLPYKDQIDSEVFAGKNQYTVPSSFPPVNLPHLGSRGRRTKFQGYPGIFREGEPQEKGEIRPLLPPFEAKGPRRAPERQRTLTQSGVTVSLQHPELWDEFHGNQTEMIITKNGRRMFPVIKIRVFGLNPESLYMVYLDLAPLDGKRYRYAYPNSAWIVSGTGDSNPKEEVYMHPDSPSTGRQWMDMVLISFDKLKLTNNRDHESKGQIFLQSMQKYSPRLFIQCLEEAKPQKMSSKFSTTYPHDLLQKVDKERSLVFSFVETRFITVTAYQNQKITRLKIDSNPFAKGFRDNSKYKETMERHLMTSGACRMPCCRQSPYFPYPPVPSLQPPLFVSALPLHLLPSFPSSHHLRTAGSLNSWPDLVPSPNFSPPSFAFPPTPFIHNGDNSEVR